MGAASLLEEALDRSYALVCGRVDGTRPVSLRAWGERGDRVRTVLAHRFKRACACSIGACAALTTVSGGAQGPRALP